MTAPAAVADRSTLRLSEVARHVVIPEGIVDSLWDDVVEICAELGDEFDAWQDGLGQVMLGLREDGTFAATVGGVVLSIPRQVAKTFLVLRVVFALCAMFPELNVIWTAQRVSTAHSAFRSLAGLASRPGATRYVSKILTGDELLIEFHNGSRVRFGARAQNFGRGETQVDVEVFDEAQILRTDTLEDMVPAANQARIPHGALLFFMGTPPRPKDEGEEFSARRAEAITDKPEGVVVQRGDMLYVECSADPECGRPGGPDLMDEAQIQKANPSFPKRTPWMSILRMRKNLKDDDSWRREALGIWDAEGVTSWQMIGRDQWNDLAVEDVPVEGDVAYGVKFSPDGERVSAAVALRSGDRVHVESLGVAPLAQGMSQLVPWLAERWRSSMGIVVDGKAGAGDFVVALIAAGVSARRVRRLTLDEVVTAHAGFLRAVNEGTLTHLGQPGLDEQVRIAGRRQIGTAASGGWGWRPLVSGGDVTALEAVTLARHAAVTGKRRTGEGRSGGNRSMTSGRKAVVL